MRVACVGEVKVISCSGTVPVPSEIRKGHPRGFRPYAPERSVGRETFQEGGLNAQICVQHISPLHFQKLNRALSLPRNKMSLNLENTVRIRSYPKDYMERIRTSNPPTKGMIVSASSGLNGPIGVQNCVKPWLIAVFCAEDVVKLNRTASELPSCG